MAAMDVLASSLSHERKHFNGSKAITKDINWSSQCKSAVSLLKERPITFVRARNQTQHNHEDDFESNDQKKLAKREKTRSIVSESEILSLIEWKNARKIGPGFSNLGNTCYLNAVLQCLCYTPCLVQHLLQNQNKIAKKKQSNSFCALQSIVNLFARVHLEPKSVQPQNSFHSKSFQHSKIIQPRDFVMNVRLLSKHFRIGRQEDAHEFFRSLLDSIQKSCLQAARFTSDLDPAASTTLIPRIFGGKLKSSLKCVKCSYVSEHLEDFQDLSLEIHNGIQSITEAIDHFTAVEKLDEKNAWKCTKCRLFNRAEKGLTIAVYPNVLVIQLKRFDGFLGGKIKKHVSFPLELTLPNSHKKESQNRTKYALYAILVHAGHSTDCGHYYSFVKGSSRQWYEMNDDSVRWVSADTVLSQRAYILFYSRVIAGDEKAAQAPVCNGKEKIHPQLCSISEPAEARPLLVKKETTSSEPVTEGIQRVNELDKAIVGSSSKSSPIFCKETKENEAEIPAGGSVVTYHVNAQEGSNVSEAQMSSVFAGFSSRFKFSYDACSMWMLTPSLHMQSIKVVCDPKASQSVKFERENNVIQSPPKPVPAHILKPSRGGVNASLYGTEIEKWNDDPQASTAADEDLSAKHDRILGNLVQEDHQRRRLGRLDSWNQSLDSGKLKKIRQKRDFVSNEGRSNSFQHALEVKRVRFGNSADRSSYEKRGKY